MNTKLSDYFRIAVMGLVLYSIAVTIALCSRDTTTPPVVGNPVEPLRATTPVPNPGDAGLSLVSNGGSASWQIPPRNARVETDFYINATTGSDTNSGLTMMAPWKTNAALGRAIGVYGILSPPPTTPTPPAGGQWVTIHYDGSMPTDLLNLQVFLNANVCLRIEATDLVTTIHTGTISAAVGFTDSNVLPSITDPEIESWNPYVGHRIIWTSGPAAGAYSWIAADLGGGVARIGQPGRLNDVVLTGISFPTTVAPSTGTYVIDGTLPTLYVGLLDTQATSNGNQIEPFVEFLDLNLASTGPIGADPNPTGATVTYLIEGCSCTWQAIYRVTIVAVLSYFPDGIYAVGGSWFDSAACVVNSFYAHIASTGGVFDNTLCEGCGFGSFQGAYVEIAAFAAEHATSSASFANLYGDGVTELSSGYTPGFISISGTVVGSGNQGVGIRVARGFTITSGVVPTITGSSGDFALDTDTSAFPVSKTTGLPIGPPLSCTWANLTTDTASGGFGGSAHSLRSNTHLITPDVGSGTGGGSVVVRISGSGTNTYTATAVLETVVLSDPAGGGTTVTAGTSPLDGARIRIVDRTGTCNSTNAKMGFTPQAGATVEDPASAPGTYTSSTVYQTVGSSDAEWLWMATENKWKLLY